MILTPINRKKRKEILIINKLFNAKLVYFFFIIHFLQPYPVNLPETITMAQRRLQQLHYRDTFWSQLSLHLEHLTLEWTTDSMVVPAKTHLRFKADKAEVSMRQQTKTEIQVEEWQEDTTRVEKENHENTEPTPREWARPYGWRWLLLALGLMLVAGTMMYRRR